MNHLLIGTYASTLVLLVTFELTPLEPTNAIFKAAVYLTAVFGAPPLAIYFTVRARRRGKPRHALSLGAIAIAAVAVSLALSMGIIFGAFTVWRSTFVEFKHKELSRRHLAHQMMDVGALGYRRRLADTTELTPFLSYSRVIDDAALEAAATSGDWVLVHEERNPFNLKCP